MLTTGLPRLRILSVHCLICQMYSLLLVRRVENRRVRKRSAENRRVKNGRVKNGRVEKRKSKNGRVKNRRVKNRRVINGTTVLARLPVNTACSLFGLSNALAAVC